MNNNQMTCDPERIELFLQRRLSDDEQVTFELHLAPSDNRSPYVETARRKIRISPRSCRAIGRMSCARPSTHPLCRCRKVPFTARE